MFIFFFFTLSFWVQVGLKGEESGLSSGSSSQWVSQPTLPKNQPLIWYKVTLILIFWFWVESFKYLISQPSQ